MTKNVARLNRSVSLPNVTELPEPKDGSVSLGMVNGVLTTKQKGGESVPSAPGMICGTMTVGNGGAGVVRFNNSGITPTFTIGSVNTRIMLGDLPTNKFTFLLNSATISSNGEVGYLALGEYAAVSGQNAINITFFDGGFQDSVLPPQGTVIIFTIFIFP